MYCQSVSLVTNSCTYLLKNTLKSYKIPSPRHVSDRTGIHPEGAITRSWLKYLQVRGASPYSRYCGCIGEPVGVPCLLCGRRLHARFNYETCTVNVSRFLNPFFFRTLRLLSGPDIYSTRLETPSYIRLFEHLIHEFLYGLYPCPPDHKDLVVCRLKFIFHKSFLDTAKF